MLKRIIEGYLGNGKYCCSISVEANVNCIKDTGHLLCFAVIFL